LTILKGNQEVKISFVGTGTMAIAMIKSIIDGSLFAQEDIMGSFHRQKLAEEVKNELKINNNSFKC